MQLPCSRGFTSIAVPQRLVVSTKNSVLYSTRKKRRRRKDDLPSEESSTSGSELPDFDLGVGDDGGNESSSGAGKSKRATTDPLGEISANMMGSSDRPLAKSVKELLSDRSLESKLEFLDSVGPVDSSLPDLLAPLRGKQVELPIVPTDGSSKRERQASRRAAVQAAAEKEEEDSILSKLPLIRDEKGQISAIKILENATWVCIGLLVVWEIYLNSPFFERAGPMAPIVYQFLL
jgi:Protein of unknown function (DUF2839)